MKKVAESHIIGEFEGFDGDRVYELDNGQKWRQIRHRYRYRYIYKYRPKVTVWADNGLHMLQVDGVDEMVEIRRET